MTEIETPTEEPGSMQGLPRLDGSEFPPDDSGEVVFDWGDDPDLADELTDEQRRIAWMTGPAKPAEAAHSPVSPADVETEATPATPFTAVDVATEQPSGAMEQGTAAWAYEPSGAADDIAAWATGAAMEPAEAAPNPVSPDIDDADLKTEATPVPPIATVVSHEEEPTTVSPEATVMHDPVSGEVSEDRSVVKSRGISPSGRYSAVDENEATNEMPVIDVPVPEQVSVNSSGDDSKVFSRLVDRLGHTIDVVDERRVGGKRSRRRDGHMPGDGMV